MTNVIWVLIAAISGFFAVLAGALGDHALHLWPGTLTFSAYTTAVRYQMWHTLVILIIGLFKLSYDPNKYRKILDWAAIVFTFGILFFPGGIYLKNVT